MNRKVLSLIILFLVWFAAAYAQNDGKITLKGVILDAKTNEPVIFANMGVLGTTAGVASEKDGRFELTVPEKYASYIVRISAVGYATYDIKISEAKEKGDMTIMLEPVAYGLDEVDIRAKAQVYQRMLKNVVTNISKNYIVKPYNYQGYFEHSVFKNGVEDNTKEAIIQIYDNRGYVRSDVSTTFGEINYKFNQVRRNRPVQSIFDGLNYFDDILTADVVRNTRNVLDIANSREYKLKGKGKLQYEGDSVQVIEYEVAKPTISTTGNTQVMAYKGEIYVNLKDFAVLKHIVNITAKNFTILGRNLMPVNEPEKSNVNIVIVTNYKKLKNVYFLSGTTLRYTYKEAENSIKGEMQYVTTRVNMNAPEAITGRMYYEDIKTNESFWNRYSVYFEGEE